MEILSVAGLSHLAEHIGDCFIAAFSIVAQLPDDVAADQALRYQVDASDSYCQPVLKTGCVRNGWLDQLCVATVIIQSRNEGMRFVIIMVLEQFCGHRCFTVDNDDYDLMYCGILLSLFLSAR